MYFLPLPLQPTTAGIVSAYFRLAHRKTFSSAGLTSYPQGISFANVKNAREPGGGAERRIFVLWVGGRAGWKQVGRRRTLGWCPLRNFWKQESIDFENGIDHGINDQDIDSRIVRMSTAAQADLRPLFHVFGILPQDSIAVQASFDQLNIPKSPAIYNRLQDYIHLIPEDNTAFINYALSVYPNLYTNGPTDSPDYGVGRHYQKSLTYNAAEAQQRTDILQSIINLYYPNGEPTGNTDPNVCCMLDTMEVNIVNEEVIVTGGVEPYNISIDVIGNVQTVTVIDFDGCESIVQYTISNLSELEKANLRVFPNPTDGKVQIDFGDIQEQVSISLFDQIGRLMQTQSVMTTELVSYQLPEPKGVYLLRITFSDGRYSSIMVIKG
ncbi:MAG: T9SS type A sorting domain-containing protein [Saprospiraceae bacterium]|nr:T9SS type A sorting domain-containing protein [Saprospiraceae bacterium]